MSFYHSQSIALQKRFDSQRIALQLERTRLHSEFTEDDRRIIENAMMFFLATSGPGNRPECSVKGGLPGFVKIVGPNALLFPDYDGNGMYRSLGNIAFNPNVGLLFLDMGGERRKLRINGVASISDSGALLNQLPGAKLAIRITALEIFPNCPRYVPQITQLEPSIYSPRQNYVPPEPLWKSKPDLKDYLPIAAVAGKPMKGE